MKKRAGYSIHVCRFSSLDDLKGRNRKNYKKVKEAVLMAGRFSCFEVDRFIAPFIDRLLKDSEVEVVLSHFPWTEVSRKRPLK